MAISGSTKGATAKAVAALQQLSALYGGQVSVQRGASSNLGGTHSYEKGKSDHDHGAAFDISLAGLSDAQKANLYTAARQAGFTDFGFGQNSLHVGMYGAPRAWSYYGPGPTVKGATTYKSIGPPGSAWDKVAWAGMPLSQLKSDVVAGAPTQIASLDQKSPTGVLSFADMPLPRPRPAAQAIAANFPTNDLVGHPTDAPPATNDLVGRPNANNNPSDFVSLLSGGQKPAPYGADQLLAAYKSGDPAQIKAATALVTKNVIAASTASDAATSYQKRAAAETAVKSYLVNQGASDAGSAFKVGADQLASAAGGALSGVAANAGASFGKIFGGFGNLLSGPTTPTQTASPSEQSWMGSFSSPKVASTTRPSTGDSLSNNILFRAATGSFPRADPNIYGPYNGGSFFGDQSIDFSPLKGVGWGGSTSTPTASPSEQQWMGSFSSPKANPAVNFSTGNSPLALVNSYNTDMFNSPTNVSRGAPRPAPPVAPSTQPNNAAAVGSVAPTVNAAAPSYFDMYNNTARAAPAPTTPDWLGSGASPADKAVTNYNSYMYGNPVKPVPVTPAPAGYTAAPRNVAALHIAPVAQQPVAAAQQGGILGILGSIFGGGANAGISNISNIGNRIGNLITPTAGGNLPSAMQQVMGQTYNTNSGSYMPTSYTAANYNPVSGGSNYNYTTGVNQAGQGTYTYTTSTGKTITGLR